MGQGMTATNSVQGVFPPSARMLLVGEAPGDEEVFRGTPFVGPSGKLLDSLLRVSGIDRAVVGVTNVFDVQLPGNDLAAWCAQATERVTWVQYRIPPVDRAMNLRPEFGRHLDRLAQEIVGLRPNIVVALGGTAMWALTGALSSEVTKRRGAVTMCSLPGCTGVKVIPTFHPAFVLRSYKAFPIVAADLIKAKGEEEFPEVRTTPRTLWVEPTLADLRTFKERYLDPAEMISIDIETIPKFRQITCVGFAPSAGVSICVPFVDWRRPNRCYWPTADEEAQAWAWVKGVCEGPAAKLGQNFTYDFQWLWTQGIAVRNYVHDTRLLHHALYPELPKDLGFMGSMYAREGAWKMFRVKTEKGND